MKVLIIVILTVNNFQSFIAALSKPLHMKHIVWQSLDIYKIYYMQSDSICNPQSTNFSKILQFLLVWLRCFSGVLNHYGFVNHIHAPTSLLN